MDTLHLTTKPDSETTATKPGKTSKRDRKAAPATKDALALTVCPCTSTVDRRRSLDISYSGTAS
jgi:hypothetical protein